MSPSNVRLILLREIRDQLRDRRTLFVVLVLPILLYPILGMSFLQVQQFLQKKPSRVLVIGAENLAEDPPLIKGHHFVGTLFRDSAEANLLELDFARTEPLGEESPPDPYEQGWRALYAGRCDAALVVRHDFGEQLETFRRALGDRGSRHLAGNEVSGIDILRIRQKEKSAIAGRRLEQVLGRWQENVSRLNLEAAGVPSVAVEPFDLGFAEPTDPTIYRGAGVWAKILPLLLVVWALTGAFYPAIDLCAGEKERGTLETLLSSPARRTEIVLGKLVCVMLFSIVTAVLNLASIGVTGCAVSPYFPGLEPPPLQAAVWLAAALLPVSALFGALSLAMASLARSTKEGQYYLVPLLLITLPLTVLPMSPAVEMNVGNSLVPVTGGVLLLRTLLEGEYTLALQYAPLVLGVTLLACYFAIRWAVEQFNSEAVLFRQAERFSLGAWLVHLRRDRKPTPTVGAALTFAVMLLTLQFVLSLTVPSPEGFAGFAVIHLATQLGLFAATAVLAAWLFTGNPRQTLLLRRPTSWAAPVAAVALAMALHPLLSVLRVGVTRMYPVDLGKVERLAELFAGAPMWQLLLLIAVVPALCEELAFRGFILSGLRHLGHKWRAILYSAIFFGLVHMILQQQLMAVVMGVVIGYVAVQSGSILPCILLHLTNNSLVLVHALLPDAVARWPWIAWFVTPGDRGAYVYGWPTVLLGGFVAAYLLFWFSRLRYAKTAEEELQENIDRAAREEDDKLLGVQDVNAGP